MCYRTFKPSRTLDCELGPNAPFGGRGWGGGWQAARDGGQGFKQGAYARQTEGLQFLFSEIWKMRADPTVLFLSAV